MTPPSPTTDSVITQRYTSKTLEGKVKNKTALQKELGWPDEPKRAIFCLPAGMSDTLGGELMKEVLPGLLSLPIELLILGKGSSTYGTLFTKLVKENSHRVAIIPDKEENRHKMLAAADVALFFSDPAGMSELKHCLSYGVVPIAPVCKGLEDNDPIQEKGTAFLYQNETEWDAFGAMVRALESFKFPYDWRTLQRHCMEA